jgi:predicted dehydrogenase
MTRHILIVGTGSAGKRHAKNLHALGCEISCMDPRQDRLDEIGAEEINLKTVFTSLEDAFAAEDRFDAVVVASPPSFHVDQCISALQQGVPVLLEKPVSPDLTGALKLQSAVKDTAVPLLLGYTWRWWPPLLKGMSNLPWPRIWRTGIPGNAIRIFLWPARHWAAVRSWMKATGWT